ncbi:hypothetical protein BDR05DRAFT_1055617 [Suillus weaverae]|nr:hypothetical protein BDR05DRAFT_1055617 [Suillus weaverae]
MKRPSVAEESPPKRPRLSESGKDYLKSLFDETRRKNATDLLDLATDETNNIEAKVHMVSPCIGKQRQVNVEMHEHGNTYRFPVLISSKVDKLLPFPFAVNDRICLSLKGAQIRPRPQSFAPCYLSVALVFKDGIAAMLMSGPSAGKVFNTWEAVGIPCVGDITHQHSKHSNQRTSSGSEKNSSSPPKRTAPVYSVSSVNNPGRNHGSLAMKAGMTTQGGDTFIPIRKIEPGLGVFNVIGVVTSTKPLAQTRSQGGIRSAFIVGSLFIVLEWCRNFSIVDPSCIEEGVVIYDFKVNCFQKTRTEWLPQAEVGDIVIFRDLKISQWRGGFNGVGYDDKLRWVTYDTQTRRFRDPDRKYAPHSEKSPYYRCTEEAEYCDQLADWWLAKDN